MQDKIEKIKVLQAKYNQEVSDTYVQRSSCSYGEVSPEEIRQLDTNHSVALASYNATTKCLRILEGVE